MLTTPSPREQIEGLVKKYKSLSAPARRGYNEDNTRKDFVLPLFRALGWNTAEASEVSAEEKVSRGWVDFSFRIQGIPRFFLETKRLNEDLTRLEWVRQAIDYAWTKGVTWALLSDFEGLRVFNAEWKEANPLQAQFLEFNVETYLPDFERLWWLSRMETAAGTLDRQAEQVGKKVRREPVSQHLFDDLRLWRSELFRYLHGWNPRVPPAQIDEAVLRILNRLIFLRTAEDREVEPPRLLALLRELEEQGRLQRLPAELARLFRDLDEVYNSDLFAPHFSEDLDCEPEPFQILIQGLHENRAALVRYNFNAIDADVLGTAYEQYLGHVIADPEAAEIVERRRKRKAQGIYYTPAFVVRYIVAQTLGRYLEEHAYHPSHPPRVLDMACGSGSFLIEAFDVLDRHVARLRGQTRGAQEDVIDHARRIEVLGNCIYGVDKDEQAVAVAKLNLSLKALHSRDRLPMLANIRCGDSLISGTPEEMQAAFGEGWRARKPFDWHQEFPEVFRDGGFDVIVGNPPYVRIQTLPKDEVAFFNERYTAATGNYDIYVLFVERALHRLRPGGTLGFILPSKFLTSEYGSGLRQLIAQRKALAKIVDFADAQVFADATTYTCLLFLQNAPAQHFIVVRAGEWLKTRTSTREGIPDEPHPSSILADSLSEAPWRLSPPREGQFLGRVATRGEPLGNIAKLFVGLQTSLDLVYILEGREGGTRRLVNVLSRATRKSYRLERDVVVPLLKGSLDMHRYRIGAVSRFVVFPYKDGELIDAEAFARHYPNCWAYLTENRQALSSREHGKMRHKAWYAYVYPKNLTLYRRPKLLTPSIASHASFSYDADGQYFFVGSGGGGGGGYGIILHESEHSRLYVLGLLNSRLLDTVVKTTSSPFRHGYYAYNKQYIQHLPIRLIDFGDPGDRARHDQMVTLVEEMLRLQAEHAEAERHKEDRRHDLQRRIEEIDRAIDALVYDLYGLTEEEIRLVEGT